MSDPRTPLVPDDGWRRLHPLTPLARGWKVVAVILALIAQQRGTALFSDGLPSREEAFITLAVLAGAALLAGLYGLVAWRCAAYQVDRDTLRLHYGVVFRQQRHARLDRLQAVDVVRPLLGRFLGLAEVRLEVAGGKDSAIVLSLLRESDAVELRNVLLARAAGVHYDGDVAPQAPETEVLQVPVSRVIGSMLLTLPSMLLLFVVVTAVTAVTVTREFAALAIVASVAIGIVGTLWGRFTSRFGFRVATSPDGIRLHHGLLTTRAQTVPPGRVQAIRLHQPLMWRRRDWWTMQVNVAGYGGGHGMGESGGTNAEEENVLLAVGTREQALLVLRLALPGLEDEDGQADDTRAAVVAGLDGTDEDTGFVVAPRASRWLDPIGWRRHGVNVLDDVVLLRRGRFGRELDVVPHARTQSLGVRQGPLQRRLALASFHMHSTAGPVHPTVMHLCSDDAAALLVAQAERARVARAASGDGDQGRWMEGR
ncbi:PH domain-containing protein [Angustibacter sp. McL0619]|uniref:PH domain-containing protein n=1 Tax=Angustibacter sp. McL0619 TaxID=3415676 RepID=UPI003CE696B5